MENKPNQHYVQQKYLEPWVKNGKLCCLRLKKDIFSTNTRNVASERYFYKLNNLTYKDCQLIRKILIDKQQEPMRTFLSGWLIPFENSLFSPYLNLEINRDLKEKALKNVLEELYMKIENEGMPGLQKLQQGDMSFIYEDKNTISNKFLLYLSFQYYRTKKIKEAVKKNIREYISYFDDFDDAFNLMSLISSSLLAFDLDKLIKDKKMYIFLIENNTSIPFIAGDQPVVNLLANFSGITTELELFYPISPAKALLITKENKFDINCSLEKVQEYNNMIEYQSLTLIFSNNEAVLQQYIK